LGYWDPGYLDSVTYEDMIRSRKLLEIVLEKAETQKQKARAMILYKAFEFYEASAVSYLGLVRKVNQPGKNADYYHEMSKKRYRLIEQFEKDPVLVQPLRFDKGSNLKSLNW